MAAEPTRLSTHRLGHAQCSILAWMLEIVAARSRHLGHRVAAADFAAGAASFRLVAEAVDGAIVDMSPTTVENLTAIALAVIDEALARPEVISDLALGEWSDITQRLAARGGAEVVDFLGACPDATGLLRYAGGVVSAMRATAGLELAEAA
jgi:hypothetical protein